MSAIFARFFVTRIGFLRSSKRILALTATHLLVVDPVTDQEKEAHELTAIKEEVAPPPSKRANGSLTAHPTKDELIYFGGEHFEECLMSKGTMLSGRLVLSCSICFADPSLLCLFVCVA